MKKRTTKKKGVNGRKKGQAAERKLAKLFAQWWGAEFARTPLSGGFATAKFREDWNASGDLVTPDPTFPFTVESKKVEGWHLEQILYSNKTLIHKWWEQTVRETPEGKISLLVFTRNRQKLFACMLVDCFQAEIITEGFGFFITSLGEDTVIIFPLEALLKSRKELWM